MDRTADYDWLFPRGPFSHQAKILERHLLYSGRLSAGRKGAEIVQNEPLLLSHRQPRMARTDRPIARESPTTGAKRDLLRWSATPVLLPPDENGLGPTPEDLLLIVSKLKRDLGAKEREAMEASRGLLKTTLEGVRLGGENQELGRQLEQMLARIGQLEAQIGLRDQKLASRDKTVAELNEFLRETAARQSKARLALKDHVEALIRRAENAEEELATLRSSLQTASSQTPGKLWETPTGSSTGALGSGVTGAASRGGHGQNQIHSEGQQGLDIPAWNVSTSSEHSIPPLSDWSLPRAWSPNHVPDGDSCIRTSARYPTSRCPESPTGPTERHRGPDGNRPAAAVNVDSGVGSFSSVNRLSAAGSAAQLASKWRPPSEKGAVPCRHPPDKSHSFTDGSQGSGASRESLRAESSIQPTTNLARLQCSPSPDSPGVQALSSRPWDLNFLTEVMEDVLESREAQNRLEASGPAGVSRHQLHHAPNVNAVSTGQSDPPVQVYKPDATDSPMTRHWSSSDYDDDDGGGDDDTDEANSAQQQIHRSNQPVKSNEPAPCAQDPHWQAAWLSVFTYLDTESLLTCAAVCRGWQAVSKHPSLWQRVRLANRKISSKFLQTISQWSKGVEHLHLEGLRTRGRAQGETRENYAKSTRGSLEPGLEYILIAAGARLITLKIVDCSNILTERSLFLASCYCRNLYSLTYVSQTDPIGHEVIWALGAGCRSIASLKVPPRQPCHQHQRLSNRCLQMIGRCWPLLLALSVGGPNIDIHGLVSIARNCSRLQVLELDHLPEVTEVIAVAMCQAGLRGLHTVILRNTLISPAAILQFNGACPKLKSISVYLNPSICAGDNRDFHNIVSKLRGLAKRRALSDVLHVLAKFN